MIVIGHGVTGAAVVRRARAEGIPVVVVDDDPNRAADAIDTAAGLRALEATDLVVPSPGVSPTHPLIAAARGRHIPVRPEIDLAAERASAPIVAITGTNGKTTVTTIVAEILERSGLRVATAGNIGRPLLDAVDEDADVLVAEVSSFQLAFAKTFRPHVAVLLNLAEDHLDWHESFHEYARAKSRLFTAQHDDDFVVFNTDEAIVAELVAAGPGRSVPFSIRTTVGFHLTERALVEPDGGMLVTRAALPTRVDLSNALAAAAAARTAGATTDAVRDGLVDYPSLPHRAATVGEAGGVRWIDDSKATNPHATAHVITRFDRVVLIAGGRNKGLDLGTLAAQADRVSAVVTIGESAEDVAAAFHGRVPKICRAGSMREAVRAAERLAKPGDVVLLSPACASFDWYESYAARGDDFAAEVAALIGAPS